MMSLTFGLFTQVSDLGLHGPLVPFCGTCVSGSIKAGPDPSVCLFFNNLRWVSCERNSSYSFFACRFETSQMIRSGSEDSHIV